MNVETAAVTGGKRYCATFGGTTVKNDASGLKLRAAPPGPCSG
jgi:hypothetical protein